MKNKQTASCRWKQVRFVLSLSFSPPSGCLCSLKIGRPSISQYTKDVRSIVALYARCISHFSVKLIYVYEKYKANEFLWADTFFRPEWKNKRKGYVYNFYPELLCMEMIWFLFHSGCFFYSQRHCQFIFTLWKGDELYNYHMLIHLMGDSLFTFACGS